MTKKKAATKGTMAVVDKILNVYFKTFLIFVAVVAIGTLIFYFTVMKPTVNKQNEIIEDFGQNVKELGKQYVDGQNKALDRYDQIENEYENELQKMEEDINNLRK